MNPEQTPPNNTPDRDETAFIGELQRFTDPPGGAPLDDPEVRARPRHGRPGDHQRITPSDQQDTPPA